MGWDGPEISAVWLGGGVERGRPRREYSREMRGDPVPQNFTDGVRPRWDERRARGGAPAGERAGEIQPAAVARASAQPRSGPPPPRVTFGCWRAGEGQLRRAASLGGRGRRCVRV